MENKKSFYLKMFVIVSAVIIFIIWLFFLVNNFSEIDAEKEGQEDPVFKTEISGMIDEGKEVLNPIK